MAINMDYDYSFTKDDIDYGVVKGDHRIVFVKTGLGGNHVGYENTYLIMARQLHGKYGCSVIVSSNPHDGRDHVKQNKEVIQQYAENERLESPELFFFGHSNGGVKGLLLACAGVAFRKMILVNMPLMINFHKTKQHLATLAQTEIVAVYGQRDPSFSYIPFLEGKAQHLRVLQIPDADHNFSGMTQAFLELGDLLMKSSD